MPLPPEVIELQEFYRDAETRIARKVIQTRAVGNSTVYLRNVQKNIKGEIAALDKFAKRWAASTVTGNFTSVMRKSYKMARESFAGLTYGNRRAMDILIENLTGNLTAANHAVGSSLGEVIRHANIRAISESTIAGDTLPQIKRAVQESLIKEGITSVRDRNGRHMRLSSYSEMVARTTYTEVNNIATTEAMLDLGNDLVRMSWHSSSCPICAPLEGRVYSISGNSRDYPALSGAFSGSYANIHPNCEHTLTPYFEKFDPNLEATKRISNRSFDTPQNPKDAEQYREQQHKKAVTNKYRKEYAAVKDLKGAPKTLSAFIQKRKHGWQAKELLD